VSVTLPASARPKFLSRLLAGAAFALAVLVAYENSWAGPFVLDDAPAVAAAISPVGERRVDAGETTSGRPLLRLTLALNHAVSGEEVWSYHAFNLLVHLLAGFVLCGIVRRTLLTPVLRDRFERSADLLAMACAALWTLHPLQTAAVTYTVQRAESLMGLCFLLTLYGFIRSTTSPRSVGWLAFSLVACLAGMTAKEVMVAAPLMVFLYDRTFVAGSFRAAGRARRWYYLSLASSWLVLAGLVAGTGGRGGTAGFDTVAGPWHYFLTQCGAVARYFGLAVWPSPLVFDYGTSLVREAGDVMAPALLLAALAGVTLWGTWRRSPWGFLGCWFLAVLAPSSSLVPVASQTMAEHRMYLALAAPVVGFAVALHGALGRRGLAVLAAAAVAGAGLTHDRNHDYRSETSLWADTVEKRPQNFRAHHNLGLAELRAGNTVSALARFEQAVTQQPDSVESLYNMGICLTRLGRPAEAIAPYERALALRPNQAEAHNNLGNARLALGQAAAARSHYAEALRLQPAFAEAHSNLSDALLQMGAAEPALHHASEAIRLRPDFADAHFNAGNACAEARRPADAQTHYLAAVRLNPRHAKAHNNLANALLELERPEEAIGHYQQALSLEPDFIDPRRNLALLLLHLNRPAAARPHLEELARTLPGDPEIARALRAASAGGRP
jgi:tetratricopeptide (TPR) repeat protein